MNLLATITHDGKHDPKRCGAMKELVRQLASVDAVSHVLIVDGGKDGPRPAARRTFETAHATLQQYPGFSGVLLLQDDVVLCHDFGDKLRKRIEKGDVPDVLFLFSTLPDPRGNDTANAFEKAGARPVAGGACTVLSRDAVARIVASEPNHAKQCTERVMLNASEGSDATVWPSWAQHRHELDSSHRDTPARSPSYAQWYPPHEPARPVHKCPAAGGEPMLFGNGGREVAEDARPPLPPSEPEQRAAGTDPDDKPTAS